MTSLLVILTMLFSFIAWSLGYDGFIIVGYIDLPWWAIYMFCDILLFANLSLQTGFVLNIYSRKVVYIAIPLTAASYIAVFSNLPHELFTGIIPFITLLMIIIFMKKNKWYYIRLITITGIILIFQWMTARMSGLDLSVAVSPYQMFRLSINGIIVLLLFYSLGGVYYVSTKFDGSAERLVLMVFPGRIGSGKLRTKSHKCNKKDSECISERSSSNVSDKQVTLFEKRLMKSVIIFVQCLQWLFILWICSFDNFFLDALIITTSFICHGQIISNRRHLRPVIFCTFAATAMFYFAARFTISFQYSQLFSIVIGLILVYTLYRVDYYFATIAKKKSKEESKKIEELKNKVDEAWNSLEELYVD